MTPIAETLYNEKYVKIAKTVEEWKSALYDSLTVDAASRRISIKEAMKNESWEYKSKQFLYICTR